MRSEPLIPRQSAPEQAFMKACSGFETANTNSPACAAQHRHQCHAEGKGASTRRVIRQPR